MVSIHIDGESVEAVLRELRKFTAERSEVSEPTTPAPKKETRNAAPAAEKPASKPAAPAPPSADADLSKQVSDIIPQLVSKLGKAEAIKLLGTFGVKKGGELKPEQHLKFLTDAKTALSAS